jgi:hypothetical protein
MVDEAVQARRVAEAARKLREHELSILQVMGAGDYERQDFNDRARALCIELDTEIAKWRVFDKPSSP